MKELYGPEDIEQLLRTKSFAELLAEEKDYVLKHIDGEPEYEALRATLFEILTKDEEIAPPYALRQELLTAHSAHHAKPGFTVWLNSVWTMISQKTIWQRPAFQFATIAVLLVSSFLIFRSLDRDLIQEPLVQEIIEKEEVSESPDKGIAPKSLNNKEPIGLSDSSSDIDSPRGPEPQNSSSPISEDYNEKAQTETAPKEDFSLAEEEITTEDATGNELSLKEQERIIEVSEDEEVLAEMDEMHDDEIIISEKREESVSPTAAAMTSTSRTATRTTSDELGQSGLSIYQQKPLSSSLIANLYTAW